MTHSVLSHRLAAGTAAVALALSAASLVPSVQAQLAPATPPAPAVTAGDAKEFEAADALFQAEKYPEAMVAFDAFHKKYKMLSPRSVDASYRLAICLLQQKPVAKTEEAVNLLKELLQLPPQKLDAAGKEQAQMLIAKARTMSAVAIPATTDSQKNVQKTAIDAAIKEYDEFLKAFPQSKSADSAQFMSGVLFLSSERYPEAVQRFSAVYTRNPASPLKMQALLNIGKAFMQEGYALMSPKKGKEPTDAEVKAGLEKLEKNAAASLFSVNRDSNDVALANEAMYYLGQILLTRSQNADNPDKAAEEKQRTDLLAQSLDAFRAVRSREEVIQAQEDKITALKKALTMLQPGTQEYLPTKNLYENLIEVEQQKKETLLAEADQFVSARLAIARIFLFLKKPDECRVLLRYLQGQKDALAQDKDAQGTVAALLTSTYLEQKNLPKSAEAFEAFRASFKGNTEGENLPLILANLYLENDQGDKAEQMVAVGKEDYKDWRFSVEANQILIAAALKKGDNDKALKLANDVLASSPKSDVEMQTLFLKATVLKAIALTKQDPAKAQEAIAAFQVVRDKYSTKPLAEDAWYEQCMTLAGIDAKKAETELRAYVLKYSSGGTSPNTKGNVANATYRLAQVLGEALGRKDEAIKTYQDLIKTYPDSEPAPGAFFKIFDIYKERKDYAKCKELMEEFVQKYPKHENVYYAFSNIAELLFSGVLSTKTGPDGKPQAAGKASLENMDEASQKLNDYVKYELENGLKVKRGDSALMKIADRWWNDHLQKLPAYVSQNPEQRKVWQKATESIITAVERLIKDYPGEDRVNDGLERLVAVYGEMLKAQVIDAAKGEAYFRNLVSQASSPELKAKLFFALGAFLQDADPKKAADARTDAVIAAGNTPRNPPLFSAINYDQRITDLFNQKKYDDVSKAVAQIRAEYKENPAADDRTKAAIGEALAVALFWEAKVLNEQGKPVEAGKLYETLKDTYPKSPKVFEANYGKILGEVSSGKLKGNDSLALDYINQLTTIVNNVRNAKNFELPAKAVYLIGQIQKQQGEFDAAVTSFRKIHMYYASVPGVSGDGLWEAAQILDDQANNKLPVRTQKEAAAAAAQKAAKNKELKDKEDAEKKKLEAGKPGEQPKPGDKPKPGEKPPVASNPPAKKP